MLIEKSNRRDKRYMATFANGRVVHFGMAGAENYTDHGDKEKRELYLKRHKAREDWQNPFSAGSLSRYLTWGDSTSLEKNHQAFMKRFPQTQKA